MTIDWTRDIETTDGQPAKLVYTRAGLYADNYLVVTGHQQTEQAHWFDDAGKSFGGMTIRNVPEPPVKLEGWIGLDKGIDRDFDAYWEAELCEGYAFLINLALVSEKCPEAIWRGGS